MDAAQTFMDARISNVFRHYTQPALAALKLLESLYKRTLSVKKKLTDSSYQSVCEVMLGEAEPKMFSVEQTCSLSYQQRPCLQTDGDTAAAMRWALKEIHPG